MRQILRGPAGHKQHASFPFNAAIYQRSGLRIRTGSVIYAAATAVVAMTVFHYSRLTTIFLPTIATMGITLIISGLLFFCSCEKSLKNVLYFLFLVGVLALLCFSVLRFHSITEMPYDIRTVGYFCGIFLPFAFVAMLNFGGIDRVLRTITMLSIIYCIIYCLATLVLQATGKVGLAERTNLILYDPFRGDRLFANSATIGFAAMTSLYSILRMRASVWNLIALGISISAMLMAQSRMAMLAMVVTLLLMVMRTKSLMRRTFHILVFLFLGSSVLIISNLKWLSQWLIKTDASTLSMRADSLYLSEYIYEHWPVLGLGYPSSASYYELTFRRPFYPEDLGGVGIISNFGLFGLVWLGTLLILMGLGTARAFKGYGTVPLGFLGVFCMLYGFTWPTFLYGDGSIFLSLLIALFLTRKKNLQNAPLQLTLNRSIYGNA